VYMWVQLVKSRLSLLFAILVNLWEATETMQTRPRGAFFFAPL
jgi:hypothetical protein